MALITIGARNFATWVHRFHRFRTFNSQAAPTSGSMGYGVPGGVAAKACAKAAGVALTATVGR